MYRETKQTRLGLVELTKGRLGWLCSIFSLFSLAINKIVRLKKPQHLTESYIVKSSAFADHAPFLLWLYRTIHVEYRQLLLRHNRKGAWSANADDFTIISESSEWFLHSIYYIRSGQI